MPQKIRLQKEDEELQMLLEVAKIFEDARKQKGDELTRSEKRDLYGIATENKGKSNRRIYFTLS